MPEGPEVWILSKAINTFYSNDNTLSTGKHLTLKHIEQIWTFGLNGKVKLDENDMIIKIDGGWINGDKLEYNEKQLGIDWMTATKEELQTEVSKWSKSKKKLAGLMLDQTLISGIGVAWGSEILLKAGLKPELKACDQSLNMLVDSMIEIRTQIQETYETELNKHTNKDALKIFINSWFENLYKIRKMNIYKKGNKIQVLGRSWYK